MKAFIVLFAICFVQGVLSQRTFNGQCPSFTPIKNFNLNRFMKTWWGWEKYTFPSQTRCTRGVYKNLGNNTISYTNVGISTSTGKKVSAAFPAKYFGKGQFSIQYNKDQPTKSPNYAVVGVAYDRWAAVTWCKNINAKQHQKIAFVLTSSPKPSTADVTAARNALKAAGLDTSLLEKYDQKGCSA